MYWERGIDKIHRASVQREKGRRRDGGGEGVKEMIYLLPNKITKMASSGLIPVDDKDGNRIETN